MQVRVIRWQIQLTVLVAFSGILSIKHWFLHGDMLKGLWNISLKLLLCWFLKSIKELLRTSPLYETEIQISMSYLFIFSVWLCWLYSQSWHQKCCDFSFRILANLMQFLLCLSVQSRKVLKVFLFIYIFNLCNFLHCPQYNTVKLPYLVLKDVKLPFSSGSLSVFPRMPSADQLWYFSFFSWYNQRLCHWSTQSTTSSKQAEPFLLGS